MDVEVRRAKLADSDQLFSLVKGFATSFNPERNAFEASLRHLLCDDSVLMNVSVLDNEVVAYCLAFDHYTLYANGRVTWVEEITVQENLRGQGIGRPLMESVRQWSVL